MTNNQKHEAVDAALGYYHQAMYALVALLGAEDDGAAVGIECRDDVELTGTSPKLLQVKHSRGTPPALTEKSDGLWKTLGIWIPQRDLADVRFLFVTCASIATSSTLKALASPDSDRAAALAALEEEAARVIQAVNAFQASRTGSHGSVRPSGERSPFAERIEACRAFSALKPAERSGLLARVTIVDASFAATDISRQVERHLTLLTKELRPRVALRLIEWWDPRVARSLLGQAPRLISKFELQAQVERLVTELADDNLPDDFGLATPPVSRGMPGSVMEHQINIVGGGADRIARAAVARWRARMQRDRWMSERVEIGAELTRFDERLLQCWRDRHGPLRHDCRDESDAVKRARGLALLDWSHHDASREVQQPRPKWTGAFLTQGTYQQLAEERRVGWHPEYEGLLPPHPSTIAPAPGPSERGNGDARRPHSSKRRSRSPTKGGATR